MDLSHEERIAAFLEGKYSGEERERLLAEFAGNDDDMEMLAAMAAALREYEEEERGAGATPLHAPVAPAVTTPVAEPRWKPPRWAYGLAAAAVLAAIIVPLLPRRGGASGPHDVVALLAAPDAGPPDGFHSVAGGVMRGEPGRRLSARDQAQLGVYLADLEMLARSRSDTAGRVAGQVAALLKNDPAQGDLAERYERVALRGGRADPLPAGLGEEATRFGGERTRLAVWLETARVAASREDAAFFRSPTSRKIIAGDGPGKLLERTSHADRQALEEALADGASPRWDRVGSSLDNLLRLLVS